VPDTPYINHEHSWEWLAVSSIDRSGNNWCLQNVEEYRREKATAAVQLKFFCHSCNIGLSTFVKPRKPTGMRKIFINKWFFLAASFTLSLSILSFAAYKQTGSVCSAAQSTCERVPASANQNTDMIWDLLSRQLSNFISIH
jgi:hypothetical protein